MLRTLLLFLALLHLGPGLAFALLAFGCEGTTPALPGGVCGRGGLAAFAGLTVLAWLLLGLGLATLKTLRQARSTPPPGHGPRLLALLCLLLTAAVLAAAGTWLSGNPRWAWVLPAALALGWLVVANPQTCLMPDTGGDAR
jgi:hypothetical protein